MESICPICRKPYDGVVCTQCTVTDLDVSGLMASEGLHVETVEKPDDGATAFLVDLVSNRKIPITTPRCKVGRDDLNDIVISGDQSISRFHFVITKENNQYLVQDGKSRHGTFLNGNQIITPEPIHDGDVLKVGVSLFWFVIENIVLGADSDKTSPVDMEADEAELEFGAPEPSAGHLVTATGSKTPANQRPASIASLSETGAFPALDMSTPEVEAFTNRVKESSGQSLIASLTQNSLRAPANDAKDPADLMQSFIDKAQEEFSSSEEGRERLQEVAKSEGDISHSYRPPHDDAKVVNSLAADPEDQGFGNLSFFEPLTEVVSELGANTLTGKEDSAAAAAEAAEDASAEPVNSVTESGEEHAASHADAFHAAHASSDTDSSDAAAAISAADAGNPHDIAASSSSDNSSNEDSQTSQPSNSDSSGEPVGSGDAQNDGVDGRNISGAASETLGSSTLEHTGDAIEAPEHNNFGIIFESGNNVDGHASGESAGENSLDFRADTNVEHGAEDDNVAHAKADESLHSEISAEATANLHDGASNNQSAEVLSASAFTLGKLAEAVEEAGSPTAPIQSKEDPILVQLISEAYANQAAESDSADGHVNGGHENNGLTGEKLTSNGAKSLMSTTKESLNATVPEWCNRYFAGELTRLSKELTDLNEQVRYAQQKIKEVEGRVSLAKGLRNTLLTATGEELVEGCGRVLSLLGWKVKISDDDKSELRIETDEKHTCIARIVYTETQADRTHLGQLSISQTRYWCEQGIEPKGILIVSRSGESGPHSLTPSDMNSELADYASKKNVCLMTTLQLLAIFKDIALHDGSMETARATIMASNGWLPGFSLEPGEYEKEEGSTNKLSSLLSA